MMQIIEYLHYCAPALIHEQNSDTVGGDTNTVHNRPSGPFTVRQKATSLDPVSSTQDTN